MHIGYITPEYPHPEVSHAAGIATSIKNLANSLVKQGVRVTVFVYHQSKDAVIEAEGVTLHLIKKQSFKFLTWYYYRKLVNRYVNTIVKQEQIHLLEAPDWTGITAFMQFKVPLVIRFHGSDAYFCKLEGRKQKFKNFVFEKLALQKAKAYIAPTSYAGEETAKIFGLKRNNIKTIHYGLDLDRFVNTHPEQFQPKTLLYIGTIIRKKGVLELAEVFNRLIDKDPNAQLLLIGGDSGDIKTGSTSTYALMQSLFSETAKSKVNYLGKIPYSEVQEHIKNAHVCTFPSFAETLGMVTIESMALQKPVVNTSLGWAQELIDDEVNGYLIYPKDTAAYAKKIITLFEDKALCLKLGQAARKKVELNFDIQKQVKKNIDYYQSLLL
ncbi:glycosyltransferase involved in cell wall biosynthesis [Mesoflavibacter sabulilitoris]|uniref:Glycosyltransferase family 1 protein n=1 Tax=Mesoflavibacter zeaxanthinifaciens subsp. sabulilitoris TaxID=1520893 RepID=A0A2T1NB16_9FLAO|nr:glycosyltransferase family 4 protein [Mesoflavibacter zeaxanthinifaciens]MBB3123528.1 glycosyltransferase involved in cell wall biosynthesis [Mesoflavibacter zeaxanthinifaciens subsp. sabulilitoris]PSG89341.1 glycosyltransferase family 1 protein [Mesoflavibacter zeaxanthinifaciens subsp. sabulilitoris]